MAEDSVLQLDNKQAHFKIGVCSAQLLAQQKL